MITLKLYRRNEILFAIAVIVAYVLVCGNLRALGDDSPYMTLGLLAFSGLLFAFVRKNGLMEKYGLSGWARNSRQMLYFIPLWIVTTGNLWGGVMPKYEGIGLLCAVASFALVGFAEELVFRGILFKAMLKDGSAKTAVIVSSVTFGIGHIVNLLTGQASFETVLQIIFAISMGFIFTFVFYKSGSMLPGIISHSLIDVFSVFSGRSETADWISMGVVLVVAIAYSICLSRVETPPVNRAGHSENAGRA